MEYNFCTDLKLTSEQDKMARSGGNATMLGPPDVPKI